MPTVFTECEDCNHLDWFPIEHKLNKNHKTNLQILRYLQIKSKFKLPPEIGIEIIKMKNNSELKQCVMCNNLLCPAHYSKGLKYGKDYLCKDNFSICNNCCWLHMN